MNASPSPPAGSPHSWLAHAKSDLRITQICRSDSGVSPNQTVFHAQQAAEKAIKAVLLEHKKVSPRSQVELRSGVRRTCVCPGEVARQSKLLRAVKVQFLLCAVKPTYLGAPDASGLWASRSVMFWGM
jgi:hypothetical protein